jgi:predicted P-loop ATPase
MIATATDMPQAWKRALKEREETELRADQLGDALEAMILNGKGEPKPCEANVCVVLRTAPFFAGRIRFNTLSGAAECQTMPWRACEGWRAWADADDVALACWCQFRGLPVKPTVCASAVQLVAIEHPFYPVQTYLDGLVWDGTERLDSWLQIYLGAEDTPYHRAVGRKALIQAVARAYEPGSKADHALIIEGRQGSGKSSAIAALAADSSWFTDEIADLGSKDSAQDLRGKWLVELAELSAMRRSEIERVKASISRRVDHYRPSYGRRSQDFPRGSVFFGTTNADTYIGDESGGRRFWPVRAGVIRLDDLRRDRDQLWAEAVAAYKARENWWLDAKAEMEARKEQAARQHEDAWDEEAIEWARRQTSPFTVSELLRSALNVPTEHQDRAKEMRVAQLLKRHGWVRRRGGTGSRPWGYVPSDDAKDETEVVTEDGPAEVVTSEVVTRGSGWAEDGPPKPQQNQCSSQPSQPSQPNSKTSYKAQNRGVRALSHSSMESVGTVGTP